MLVVMALLYAMRGTWRLALRNSGDGDPLARVHGDPPFRDGDRGVGVRGTIEWSLSSQY